VEASRSVKLERLPEPWLDPDSTAQVNQMFYGPEPHSYFKTRLALLLVMAGKPEALRDIFREGVRTRASPRAVQSIPCKSRVEPSTSVKRKVTVPDGRSRTRLSQAEGSKQAKPGAGEPPVWGRSRTT